MEWGQGQGTVSWGRGRGCSYVAWAWRMYRVIGRARYVSEGSAMWHLEGERLNHVEQELLKLQECFSHFHALRGDVGEKACFTSVLVHGHHCVAQLERLESRMRAWVYLRSSFVWPDALGTLLCTEMWSYAAWLLFVWDLEKVPESHTRPFLHLCSKLFLV